jgi:drug/metabolite transporter (DMT)-like permease
MHLKTIIDFLLLAALWGGSFLLMRIAAPEFGAFALSGVRVFIAGTLLLVLLVATKRVNALAAHWKPIATVGLMNSAFPFLFFAYAMAHISSGLGAILNATVPLWGAIVAFVWLKDRISGLRVLGLLVGFTGVTFLVWDKISLKPGSGLAVLACLGATFLYGISASFTKKYLVGVDSLASATGSQLSAAIVLLPLGFAFWPSNAISLQAWAAACVLAVFCTALAYILYFRLFAKLGPSKTITVTFLIPVFGMTWGGIFLHEIPTAQMLVACAIIIFGTALSAGLLAKSQPPKTANN